MLFGMVCVLQPSLMDSSGKTSKRTPVRLRHKIQKASAAKGRKERKLAKKVSVLFYPERV